MSAEAEERPVSKRVVVRTPVGDFYRTTTKTFVAVSVYRLEPERYMRGLGPGDYYAVWHTTLDAAANAPLRKYRTDLVGQYFVDTKTWEPIVPLKL